MSMGQAFFPRQSKYVYALRTGDNAEMSPGDIGHSGFFWLFGGRSQFEHRWFSAEQEEYGNAASCYLA